MEKIIFKKDDYAKKDWNKLLINRDCIKSNLCCRKIK